ncbi:LysR family transcriptional regulator [Enterococcus sp. BWM-S5]|uniref:LysR family transcriptional regulator n=1 Tax=Enterococcus larvae TaxID=2794352 RepID=A0ABS4CER2_9ENTE|nr:LysR family transcriptional regulator [Enterococcus larvae]MBP1045006.1 LysR family transcriptional regulator [Enterococcus larvae]
MNIQKFEAFVVLAETLNYTETAERLYTTQGNISKQIISLEKDLEVQLFTRTQRVTQLTEAGTALLPYAKKMVDNFYELKQSLRPFKEAQHQVTLHGIPTMSSYQILKLVGEFHKNHPDIPFKVKEEESVDLINSLKNDRCDIIFLRSFDNSTECSKDYEQVLTGNDRFVAVLPNDHPLAKKESISLIDLRQETFFQLGESTQLYDVVRSMCKTAGFDPTIGYAGHRNSMIMNLVANKMGISLMMAETVDYFDEGNIVAVPLKENVSCNLYLIKKKKTSNSGLEQFWTFLQQKTNLSS